MSAPLFLVDALPGAGPYRLDGAEGHHAADVQRLRPGATLILADGRGGVAVATVVATARGALDLAVAEARGVPAPCPRLVAVQGIAKGDRGELAVQAMTEVGVDEIVPWAATRCVAQWRGERGQRSLERWRATAREAAKQSRRVWLPTVSDAVSTAALVRRLSAGAGGPGLSAGAGEQGLSAGAGGPGLSAGAGEQGLSAGAGERGLSAGVGERPVVLVLHEEAEVRLTAVDLPGAGEVCVVVGPEGGITPEEIDQFGAAGAVPVRLGDTVLRTSTAGVAALAVLAARLGRW